MTSDFRSRKPSLSARGSTRCLVLVHPVVKDIRGEEGLSDEEVREMLGKTAEVVRNNWKWF
jgi:hypothetical protein